MIVKVKKATPVGIALALLMVGLLFVGTSSAAAKTRAYESSFGSFTGSNPQALTVDQDTGDIYAISSADNSVSRFDANGNPKNFTAGPNAGTNKLTGFQFDPGPSAAAVAVDNSGGPADGSIYVADAFNMAVKVFDRDGNQTGTLTGATQPGGGFPVEPCGVAVDQTNGYLYVGDYGNRISRYEPTGAGAVDGDYAGAINTGFAMAPCQVAAHDGSVYATHWDGNGPLRKYNASDFATGTPPSPSSTSITSTATTLAIDPASGDLYVNEGNRIAVMSANGNPLYTFGSAADFGTGSTGVAVASPGGRAYVADSHGGGNEIDVYGSELEPGSRANLFSFGSFTGSNPQALTVDQDTGDIYAISSADNSVSRFDSSGDPKNFTAGPNAGTNKLTGFQFDPGPSAAGVAVDNSGGPADGSIYVADAFNMVVKVYDRDGNQTGTLTGATQPGGGFPVEPCGVAVDQTNGHLYVGDYGNRISRYEPSGAGAADGDYAGAIATGFSMAPCQVAAHDGSVYATHWDGNGPLRKYNASDFATGTPPSPSSTVITATATTLAIDLASGDLYVNEGNRIAVMSANGNPLHTFGAAPDFGAGSSGVAVTDAGNRVYVSDPVSHQVDAYGPYSPPADPPVPTTKAATTITYTKAMLNGSLDPGSDSVTGCYFEWGETSSYGSTVPCAEGSSFEESADVSAELTGLDPDTTYHFRLHLESAASGDVMGEDEAFSTKTPGDKPDVTAEPGEILSTTSARLTGTVNPVGIQLTSCQFEYVTELAFNAGGFDDLSSGGSVECSPEPGSIPADFESHDVIADAEGLDPEASYYFRLVTGNANGNSASGKQLVLGPPIVETTGSTYRTATTARFDSRVNPRGNIGVKYWFEYVTADQFEESGFDDPEVTEERAIPSNEVQRLFISPIAGENDSFQLNFKGAVTNDVAVRANPQKLQRELEQLPTIGEGNVLVSRPAAPTTSLRFRIEFRGELGDVDQPALTIESGQWVQVGQQLDGGRRSLVTLVSAPVEGLQAGTEYRYRVVAADGAGGSTAQGEPVLLRTRASDVALSPGDVPGPPDSDRGWELVSPPDTGGSPASVLRGISSDGNRAVYNVLGGTPESESGSFNNPQFAERTDAGWQTKRGVFPSRGPNTGDQWGAPLGSDDLSTIVADNNRINRTGIWGTWRMSATGSPELLSGAPWDDVKGYLAASSDGSRVINAMSGQHDPEHSVPEGQPFMYDVSSGEPKLVAILPDGSVPPCQGFRQFDANSAIGPNRSWLSADGNEVVFSAPVSGSTDQCSGGVSPSLQLYLRDLPGGETVRVSPEPLSGPACLPSFVRLTGDYVYFHSGSRLTADAEAYPCPGTDGNIFRYSISGGDVECITCLSSGMPAAVRPNIDGYQSSGNIAIAADDSRAYFWSKQPLLEGAGDKGAIYRVDLATGDLALVAQTGQMPGVNPRSYSAINEDGSVLVFRGQAEPTLDSVGGPQSAATEQYYRYDDRDRSLTCISCPVDGTAPRDEDPSGGNGFVSGEDAGPNLTPVSDDGDVAFTSPSSLVPADQNTARTGQPAIAGSDIYEWRDGALHLVTDGLTTWPGSGGTNAAPRLGGITPDGSNVFFAASKALTPDAVDDTFRVYTARIDGGFEDKAETDGGCIGESCLPAPDTKPGSEDPSSTSVGSGNPRGDGSRPTCAKQKDRLTKAKRRLAKAKGKRSKTKARSKAKSARKGLRKCRRGNA